jgi:hypothetical protein
MAVVGGKNKLYFVFSLFQLVPATSDEIQAVDTSATYLIDFVFRVGWDYFSTRLLHAAAT